MFPEGFARRCAEAFLLTAPWVEQAHPSAHRVWSARAITGERFFLKRFQGARAYRQAKAAYERWAPLIAAQLPAMLAADDATRALLLSAALDPEVPLETLTPVEVLALYRAAGGFLGALQSIEPAAVDPIPLPEALLKRAGGWLRRAEGLLPPHALTSISARLHDPPGGERVPAHRDFQPGNWIVGRVGGEVALAVIDLEHARDDHPLVDLLRLWDGPWTRTDARWRAFLQGWGRRWREEDQAALGWLEVLHGLATVVWGLQRAEETFILRGRAVLMRHRLL